MMDPEQIRKTIKVAGEALVALCAAGAALAVAVQNCPKKEPKKEKG